MQGRRRQLEEGFKLFVHGGENKESYKSFLKVVEKS